MFKKKYDPHIRIKFSLFDDPQFKKIPNENRSHCLSVFICLLKFVNNQTLKCYPRKATISSMTGLSYATIYRSTNWLIKVGMVSKKRLPSTLLYSINPDYIVGLRQSDHTDYTSSHTAHSDRSVRPLLKELSYISIISNLIKEVVSKGGDKNVIIDKLSTLPRSTLIKAINERDNPFYCKQALTVLDNKGNGVLVDIPQGKDLLEKIRKKTNFAYQRVIYKSKRDHDRKIKSKDLLRRDSKD